MYKQKLDRPLLRNFKRCWCAAASGGSRKFWWGMIKILSTKPQKLGCVVTWRVARNLQRSGCFRGLGAELLELKNFAFFLQK